MATWNLAGTKHHVLICNGGSCMRKGGEEVTSAIREEIARLELHSDVHTTRTRCNGRCDDACVVIVYPEGIWYKAITPEVGKKLVQQHLLNGQPLAEAMMYRYEQTKGFVLSGMTDVSLGISK